MYQMWDFKETLSTSEEISMSITICISPGRGISSILFLILGIIMIEYTNIVVGLGYGVVAGLSQFIKSFKIGGDSR